jgi:hypothetical protein
VTAPPQTVPAWDASWEAGLGLQLLQGPFQPPNLLAQSLEEGSDCMRRSRSIEHPASRLAMTPRNAAASSDGGARSEASDRRPLRVCKPDAPCAMR